VAYRAWNLIFVFTATWRRHHSRPLPDGGYTMIPQPLPSHLRYWRGGTYFLAGAIFRNVECHHRQEKFAVHVIWIVKDISKDGIAPISQSSLVAFVFRCCFANFLEDVGEIQVSVEYQYRGFGIPPRQI